jgi:magnesium-transporting ATPase (P-type)
VAETLKRLHTSMRGLTVEEAEQRKARFGLNRLTEPPKQSEILRFLRQFHNVLIYVMLVGALLASIVADIADAIVIVFVVIVNAVIGYVQEGRAEQALNAIRRMIDPRATVIRDDRRSVIAAEDIVPGDLVMLEPGDRVPADLRLTRARNLRIDEAVLTGESVPVDKGVEPVQDDIALGDRSSMAFSGTFVASGNGGGIAVATGGATELGRISLLVGSIKTLTTPLLRQMAVFGRQITFVILGIVHGDGEPCRRCRAGGLACGDHHSPRHRCAAHGGAKRHRSAAACGRGARLGVGDLLGQDRHTYPQ